MAGHHKTLHIAQGEFITAKGAEASISTILGSCVATCLYDEGGQVGGMNHFLLPDGAGPRSIPPVSASMRWNC